MNDETFKPLMYLKVKLDVNGDFLKEWKRLSIPEKEELRDAAKMEYDYLVDKETPII